MMRCQETTTNPSRVQYTKTNSRNHNPSSPMTRNDNHEATLRFEDGSTKTVAVRPDVDLGQRKVGETVVIRITEALAINVEKQP
jgi:hypothetical protein